MRSAPSFLRNLPTSTSRLLDAVSLVSPQTPSRRSARETVLNQYTLEKELVGGQHDFYAALVDNLGVVVASSRTYQLKNSDGTSVTNSSKPGSTMLAQGPITVVASPRMVTGGIGVVAFGLILIVLGQSLRARREEIVKRPA